MNVSKQYLTLVGLAGFIAGSTHAAPIPGTGWNQDTIVEATATNSAAGIQAVTTTGFAGLFVLTEQGFAGVGSGTPLPSSGQLTTINGTVFQLASYTGNNSFVDTVGGTGIDGTFTLDTPGSYSSLQFFVHGIGDQADGDNFFATVNFSDASSTTLSFHVRDWQFSSVGFGDYNAFGSKSDFARRAGNPGLALWTRELQFPLSVADQAKTITSIDFVLQDRLGVAAVSGEAIPEPASLSLTIAPNASNPGHYDFEWDSRAGKVYDLVSSTDLATAPDSWPVWQGQTSLGATPPTNMLTDIAGGGDPRRFFAVLEKDAPPLLNESFDRAGAPPAGWTTNGPVSGTTWNVGTPSGVASGPAAAHSPDYCAGTNVTGYYTGNTNVSLVSPVLAVPSGSGATLKYWQFIDTDLKGTPHDLGSVRILDADNADTPIAGLEITGIEGDGTAGWTEQTLALPEGGVGGKNIKVEFRFVSNPGDVLDDDVWSGFYIDDVLVTVP